MTTWMYLTLALIGLALIAYGLWKYYENQPFAILLINGESHMAIPVSIGVPALVEFEALDSDNNPIVVPDDVEVTFTYSPADAGEYSDRLPLQANFTAAIAGDITLQGRAFISGQEYIATQIVTASAVVASVRLRVNGQVEPTP